MLQIGYFSSAFAPQDAPTVHKILLTARRNNRRDGITGLLVAGGGRYLQVIEGPGAAMETLFEKIRKDERHVGVVPFLNRPVTTRNFGDWSMAFRRDPALGLADNFPSIVQALTADMPDGQLRQQIRYFAERLVANDGQRVA